MKQQKTPEQKETIRKRAAEAVTSMQKTAQKNGVDKMTDEEIEVEITAAREERRRLR